MTKLEILKSQGSCLAEELVWNTGYFFSDVHAFYAHWMDSIDVEKFMLSLR